MNRALTKLLALLAVVLAAAVVLPAQDKTADDPVARAMKDELARSIEKLRLPNLDKPYFISYRIDDLHTASVSASLGALTQSSTGRSRLLSIDMRVGDYALDNSNFLAMQDFRRNLFAGHDSLPLDDDYDQLRREIWLATDREYKSAAESLASKRSVLEHRQSTVSLPDFIKQEPVKFEEPPAAMKIDVATLEKLARDVSGVFRDYPEIFVSSVEIEARDEYTRYLNTEGSWFTRATPLLLLHVSAEIRGDDGLPITDSFEFYARTADSLPSAELVARTRKLADGLRSLRSAAFIDNYNGPVLFEGEAGAEALGQVFAPALTASRFPITDQPQAEAQLQQYMGQFGGTTLADRINGRVLPAGFDLTDEPATPAGSQLPLFGDCRIDDEAVRSRQVKLIENGILKTVLSTRTPTQQTKESTGSSHAMGASPCNLILATRAAKTGAELKAQLLQEVKDRGLPYGIIVRRVGMGGLSWTMRMAMAQATGGAAGSLAEVYRVFPDGREERLRELEVDPMTPAAFKDIVAAGGTPALYNGAYIPMAGSIIAVLAGRGMDTEMPDIVSYVAPSLLFDDVSLKRTSAPAPNAPIAASPLASQTASGGK